MKNSHLKLSNISRDSFTAEVRLHVVMGSGFMVATEKDQEYRDFFTNRHLFDAYWGQGMPRKFRFSANEIEVEDESDSTLKKYLN